MKRFLCIIILLVFLIFMYAKYIEPNQIVINEYKISNNKIPSSFEGIKIAHFSDILYDSENDYKQIEIVTQKIQELNADIIVFTGDLVQKKINENEKNELTSILTNLKPNLYKYAVLGDHDSNDVKDILKTSGFIVLENTSTYLFYESNEPILIAGGDNITSDSLLKDENIPYNFKIALTHKPDNYDSLKNEFNLVLAGHSLGGEIRIPFYGATIKKEGAKKYTDKMYSHEDNYLYISSGIGIEKTGLRLLNKPSINVYRLYNK
ncbi:MAG: metallophosphoesterase [Firmicutes bacterium]|nr:metallophosphoesterase [Bacillota bacterium]